MITLQEVNNRIESIQKVADSHGGQFSAGFGTKEEKRAAKDMRFFMDLRALLEKNISEDYLLKEKKRLSDFIESKWSQYKSWPSPKDKTGTQLRGIYKREVGIATAESYLKVIDFILKK